MTLTQGLLIILGLALAFFGLPLYRSFIKVIGFIVGAGYGLYLFSLFAESLNWDPLYIYIAAVLLVAVLGIAGSVIAQFANAIMFFLVGGLVGVILGKFVGGMTADDIGTAMGTQGFLQLIHPQMTDLWWFIGGGLVFIIAIDALIMFALSTLGAGLIWYSLSPFGLLSPDWVIPLIIGVLGLMVQEAARRRAREGAPLKRFRAKEPPRSTD